MEKLLRTGDVLKQAGISREVFYRYITMGLVKSARTTKGGRNYFAESVFKHIDLIRSLNESGFTLRDIKDTYFRDERVDAAMAREAQDEQGDDAPPGKSDS